MSLSRILAVNEDPEVGDLRRVGGEGDGLGLERSSPWRLPLDEPVSPINLSWAAAMRRTGTECCPVDFFPVVLKKWRIPVTGPPRRLQICSSARILLG